MGDQGEGDQGEGWQGQGDQGEGDLGEGGREQSDQGDGDAGQEGDQREGKGSEGKNGMGKKGLGGRRHSAAVAQQRGGLLASPRSSSPRSEKWRSLARVVLGNVEEGGEPVVRQDETGDG